MADYKFTGWEADAGVMRYADGAFIPNDDENADWLAFVEYMTQGGVVDPYMTTQQLQTENRVKAGWAQHLAMERLDKEERRVKYGLPAELSEGDKNKLKKYITDLQADVENPSSDHTYEPADMPV